MPTLTRSDLWSLEQYAEQRPAFRARVMAHKKLRQLPLGEHARLYFEDELTIRYQIQEMLRIEKVFEPAAINEELAAYNPLIPDGHNWKATFMIEYEDPVQRGEQLARMIGIENKVWLQIEGFPKTYAIADEDMDRANDSKTSAVHFLRFELSPAMVSAVTGSDAAIAAGIDHPAYSVSATPIPAAVRAALSADLNV